MSRVGLLGVAAVGSLTAAIVVAGTFGADAAAPPPPPNPPYEIPVQAQGLRAGAPLSGTVESAPRYVAQTSCDPRERIGVIKFRKLVQRKYKIGTNGGSLRNCTDDSISEHLEGRAWDWNVNANKPKQARKAADLLQWLTQVGPDGEPGYNARRLGIMYIGYNYRIWGAYNADEGWRVLGNENPHTDHVHFSFTWNGANAKTSYWKGVAAPEDYGPCALYLGQPAPLYVQPQLSPCTTPAALPPQYAGWTTRLWRGSKGAKVSRVQEIVGARKTGKFDKRTQRMVARWQVSHGLPRTGVVDAMTSATMNLR